MAQTIRTQHNRDENRARRLAAVRRLEQLIEYAQNPDFTGDVAVEIHAHQGILMAVKIRIEELENSLD